MDVTHQLLETLSKGICYFPTENDAFYNVVQRRLKSPGIAKEAFVVRFSENGALDEQYSYVSIYDAIREIISLKSTYWNGVIELFLYTDTSGMEKIRSWEYEYKGHYDCFNECNVIDCAGWVKC